MQDRGHVEKLLYYGAIGLASSTSWCKDHKHKQPKKKKTDKNIQTTEGNRKTLEGWENKASVVN